MFRVPTGCPQCTGRYCETWDAVEGSVTSMQSVQGWDGGTGQANWRGRSEDQRTRRPTFTEREWIWQEAKRPRRKILESSWPHRTTRNGRHQTKLLRWDWAVAALERRLKRRSYFPKAKGGKARETKCWNTSLERSWFALAKDGRRDCILKAAALGG